MVGWSGWKGYCIHSWSWQRYCENLEMIADSVVEISWTQKFIQKEKKEEICTDVAQWASWKAKCAKIGIWLPPQFLILGGCRWKITCQCTCHCNFLAWNLLQIWIFWPQSENLWLFMHNNSPKCNLTYIHNFDNKSLRNLPKNTHT